MSAPNESMAMILIVDDEVDILNTLAMALNFEGHEVISATDGTEAFKILQEQPEVDLVVTDAMMPSMNGYELIHRIRASANHAQMPIILMSAAPSLPNTDNQWNLFLRKPFDLEMLFKSVTKFVSEVRPKAH